MHVMNSWNFWNREKRKSKSVFIAKLLVSECILHCFPTLSPFNSAFHEMSNVHAGVLLLSGPSSIQMV